MNAWLIAVWDSLRNSYWFLPSLCMLAGVVLGVLMPVVDARVDQEFPLIPWVETTGDAARATLGAMAGALITVTSLVFSMTMVTLSLTTSQFGSRLLRTFSEQMFSQLTLGIFLGTSVYCLLVLRSVRTIEGEPFVPHLSTAVGAVASIAALVTLIAFIHYTSLAIQAQAVVRAVAQDLDESIEAVCPNGCRVDPEREVVRQQQLRGEAVDFGDAQAVLAHHDGYIQAIDLQFLVHRAQAANCKIKLLHRPGNFATAGTPLALVQPRAAVTAELEAELRGAIVIGTQRTPRQDLECSIHELVEVAVRALSPGINDPHTAINCIDYLTAIIHKLAGRQFPDGIRTDSDGNLRVILPTYTFAGALDASLHEIRQAGAKHPAILIRLLERLQLIAAGVKNPRDLNEVRKHAEIILRTAEREISEPVDLEDVRARYEAMTRLN